VGGNSGSGGQERHGLNPACYIAVSDRESGVVS